MSPGELEQAGVVAKDAEDSIREFSEGIIGLGSVLTTAGESGEVSQYAVAQVGRLLRIAGETLVGLQFVQEEAEHFITESGQRSTKLEAKGEWNYLCTDKKTVDDLTFTSRDEEGRICWWDVTVPETNYWHVHQMLGRAYAFELLDLIHNKNKSKELCDHTLGFIASEIVRQTHKTDGIYYGFIEAISEFLITGKCAR